MAKEKKEDPKYINAPLHIFQSFQRDPVDTLEEFITVGVHRFATKIRYSHDEVFRQLIYGYNYNTDHLSNTLIAFIRPLLDSYGYTNGSKIFDLTEEKTFEMTRFIEIERDHFLKSDIVNEAILHYQLEQAKKLLGVSFRNEYNISKYRKFEHRDNVFISKYGKDASVSLTKDMLFDFKENDKKPFELDLFCAYVAIKSIQGSSEYCKTNKAFIKMRMLGAKSKKALTEALKISENKGFYKRIDNRYQIDKLIDKLLEKGFIQSKIGRERYVYISTQLSFDLLPQAIAAANKPKILKEKEKAANELLNRLLTQ